MNKADKIERLVSLAGILFGVLVFLILNAILGG